MGRVTRAITVERNGSTLLFKDADGLRHAVRASAILAASDVDDTRDATVLQLPGARFLVVRSGLDDVLSLISGPPAVAVAPPRPAEDEVEQARIVVSNLRAVWLRTMSALMEEGVLPSAAFRTIRDQCLEAASAFARSGGVHHQSVGAEGAQDILALFAELLPDETARR